MTASVVWACPGHPAGPFDAMGEDAFCDGSCVQATVDAEVRRLGLLLHQAPSNRYVDGDVGEEFVVVEFDSPSHGGRAFAIHQDGSSQEVDR